MARELPSFDDIPPFGDFTFDEPVDAQPFAPPPPSAVPPVAEPPALVEPEVPEQPLRPISGPAYITVTDAAGRVLFRRPATEAEVDDALRAAGEAEREGSEAMDRIAQERLAAELGDFDGEVPS